MTTADRHDLVIIGMGSCGLTAAEFAAEIGIRVAVVERARPGGDCLWTGCVPSKALIAAAKTAHSMRHADRFGLEAIEPEIDLSRVWGRVRAVQEEIAVTDDNPERFRALGIDLITGSARLVSPNTVLVDEVRSVEARHVLVCTGSRPVIPELDGLAETGFLTNEDVFEFRTPPRSIVVLGGGPIGAELAQAFNRLGIVTTLVQRGPRLLPREEPALARKVEDRLRTEGVTVLTGATVIHVGRTSGQVRVVVQAAGHEYVLEAEEILVAAGRRPNVEGLGLAELGIEVTEEGVVVDERGRTAASNVYAAGDVTGRHRYTHVAAHDGVRAVRDMFFPGKGSADEVVPWCTFTDPELAHVGLTAAEAEHRYGSRVDVWRFDLVHNDRARTDAATDGSIVVVTARRKVVGAHVLAPSAGEMIHELALAVRHGWTLGDLAALIHVYPTYSLGIGQLAGHYAFERARRLRWLVRR